MTSLRYVSVIICTYNRAESLSRVLQCLMVQSYDREAMEIVVVDNNSTDHTAQIVSQYAETGDKIIHYIFEPRAGISVARNRGAAAAVHPFIAFIDDDCTVQEDWLMRLMHGFDLEKNVVVVGGLVKIAWEEPRPNWFGTEMEPWLADTGFLGNRQRILANNERIVEANTVFDRAIWKQAGGFMGMEQFGSHNMAASEILFLLDRLRKQGGKIAFIPEAVAYHHVQAPQKKRLLRRAYWQGVSDVMLHDVIKRSNWLKTLQRLLKETAASLVLSVLYMTAFLSNNQSKAMFQLMRLAWRIGVIATLLRLEGNWRQARLWHANQITG